MTFRIPMAWLDRFMDRIGVRVYLVLGPEQDTDNPRVGERVLTGLRVVIGRQAIADYQAEQIRKANAAGRFEGGQDL